RRWLLTEPCSVATETSKSAPATSRQLARRAFGLTPATSSFAEMDQCPALSGKLATVPRTERPDSGTGPALCPATTAGSPDARAAADTIPTAAARTAIAMSDRAIRGDTERARRRSIEPSTVDPRKFGQMVCKTGRDRHGPPTTVVPARNRVFAPASHVLTYD